MYVFQFRCLYERVATNSKQASALCQRFTCLIILIPPFFSGCFVDGFTACYCWWCYWCRWCYCCCVRTSPSLRHCYWYHLGVHYASFDTPSVLSRPPRQCFIFLLIISSSSSSSVLPLLLSNPTPYSIFRDYALKFILVYRYADFF